jgi:hypothetical protein
MKYYLMIISIFLTLNSFAQLPDPNSDPDPCGTSDLSTMLQDPVENSNYLIYKNRLNNYLANLTNTNQRLINNNGIITIPVIVHVLHCGEAIGAGRNISVAQIQSQIDVLNEDFRRLNGNRINTPAPFASVAADFGIEFKLACVNPAGGFTDGIVRVRTNVSTYYEKFNIFGTDEIATGIKVVGSGSPAWPSDKYLNIWVANLRTYAFNPNKTLRGYSTRPTNQISRPEYDGVVVSPNLFGRVGNLNMYVYNQGRTATHEIGHWLGLEHIFGNNTFTQCVDDGIFDTPIQRKENNTNCLTFPYISGCNTNVNPYGDMFMNYMDYTGDACKNMFTIGQKDVCRAVFVQGFERYNIIENNFNIQLPASVIKCQGKVKLTNNLCLSSPQWTVVSGPGTILFGQGSDEIILKGTGVGNVLLRCTAGNYTTDRLVQVNQDGPDPITNVATSYVMVNCNVVKYKWTVDGGAAATQYKWSYRNVTSGTPFSVFKNGAANWATSPFGDGSCDQIEVMVEAINPCAITPPSFLFMSDQCPPYTDGSCSYGRSLLASPSPSVTNVQLKLVDEPNLIPANTQPKKIKQVRVVDRMGQIKQTYTGNDLDIMTINLSALPADIYTILVSDGKVWMSKQVSKN